MTLKQRMARADRRQRVYREDPDHRLAAINRTRRNAGRPAIASLEESRNLYLGLEPAHRRSV